MMDRKAPRHPAHFRTFFSAGLEEGEGMACDLSKQGCRVESDTIFPVGTEVEVWLFSPDFDWPLKIDKAIVRWTAPEAFGAEFLEVGAAQRERLRLLLAGGKLGVAG